MMYFWFWRSSQVELRCCDCTSPVWKERKMHSNVGNITRFKLLSGILFRDLIPTLNPSPNKIGRWRNSRISGHKSYFRGFMSNFEGDHVAPTKLFPQQCQALSGKHVECDIHHSEILNGDLDTYPGFPIFRMMSRFDFLIPFITER